MLLKQVGADEEYENYDNVKNYRDYDAIWILPNIEKALSISVPKASIGRGYEIQMKNRKDSWLLVDKNGTRSYYERN